MGGCGRWGVHLPTFRTLASLPIVRWTSNTQPCPLPLCSLLVPCPSALAQLAMPAAKKAKLDFLGLVSKNFVGSGDPEISDAKDVVTYLSEKYKPTEWKSLLQGLHQRVLNVTGNTHPTAKSTVPDVAVGSTEDMWVMVWHLGHLEEHAYRGRPQTVHILEKAQSLLERTFDSETFPVKLALPGPGAIPGAKLGEQVFKHVVGFTRCLAAMVILEGAASLPDTDLLSLSDVLMSCLCIKAAFKAYASEDQAREESLRLKFQVADSVRPTVFQIYFNLRKRAEQSGKDFITSCDEIIKTFNSATDIEGYKISALESKVILMLPHQTEVFFESLKYHWQNYKTGESAVPLSFFDDETGLFSEVESERKGVWAKVYELSAFKNEVTLLYLVGFFLKAIKEVLRKKQKPNLRNAAQRLRVKEPRVAMKIACLWVHFRPQVIKVLSKEDFEQCEHMFFRGGFEREFTDKVNAENEALKFEDFRFVTMFKSASHLEAHCPLSRASADVDESTLQEQADDSQLAVITRHLQEDQTHWDKHLMNVRDHEDAQRLSKRLHDRTLHKTVDNVSSKLQESNYAARDFKADHGLGPWIPSCLLAWSDANLIPLADTYVMYWLDLSKASLTFKKVLPLLLRVVSEAVGHKPHSTAAIVAAPLIGARGDGADAAAADAAHDDCETMIKLPIYKLTCRRITFSWAENNQATDSWCTHPGWLLYTDTLDMSGDVPTSICEFTKSRLCRHRGVVGLSQPEVHERLCPSSSVPISAVNMSQGQRRLQKIGGIMFFGKLRDAVWSGMRMSPRHGGAWVDMLGYDSSLSRSVLIDSTKARPTQPREMVVTTVTTGGDDDTDEVRKRITKWIQQNIKREIVSLIKAKTLLHPDVVVSEWRSTVQCPSCDTTRLKVSMPTADNCLAIKQTTLEEWEKKITKKHEALKALMEQHNKKYNTTGQTFKTSDGKPALPLATHCPQSAQGEPEDWPAEQTYDSMDAVKDGNFETMSGSPAKYTLHTSNNKLLIQAHEDGVLGNDHPLCHIWGKYHTGSEVGVALKKKLSLMPLEVNSVDFTAYFSGLPQWEPAFTTAPATLGNFADYLESHGVADFSFVCHEVKIGSEDDVEDPLTIKNTEKCSFEPTSLPPKTSPSGANFGSKIPRSKIDWNTGKAAGNKCEVKFHLQYSDTAQLKGIKPDKPALFLTNFMHIKKGKVYAVIW